MISPETAMAFDGLIESALNNNCVSPDAEAVIVSAMTGKPIFATDTPLCTVVVSISSYRFRIVTLFEIPTSATTLKYFSSVVGAGASNESYSVDVLCEFANRVCGELNRMLNTFGFMSGMSTPYILDAGCCDYASFLQPSYQKSYRVSIGDVVSIGCYLNVCVLEGVDVEFPSHYLRDEDSVTAGELEIF